MSKSLYQTNVESRAPLTTDVGVVGNWWVDTSASPADLYLCTDATGGVYTWTKQGGGSGGGVQQDTSATSVATLYTALEALRTAGKTILSIEFTPTSNINMTVDQTTTTNLTTPTFTSNSTSKTIFYANKKYVLCLTTIRDIGVNTLYNFNIAGSNEYFIQFSLDQYDFQGSGIYIQTTNSKITVVGHTQSYGMPSVSSYTINYI